MKNNVLIYADQGVSPRFLKLTVRALRDAGLSHLRRVKQCNLTSDHAWEDETALLVVPGGRDTPYHNALSGEGNRRIRRFVESGGKYLGLCAGGYYGAARVEFELGHPLEVIGDRELAFFPGIARGPAYGNGQFTYNTETGARIAQLSWGDNTGVSYFNGGCCFVDAESYPNVEVMARYRDIEGEPVAVISCKVGEGIAILSGVHPECSAADLAGGKSNELTPHEDKRAEFFTHILNTLELPT